MYIIRLIMTEMTKYYYIITLLALVMMTSCIKNDIPYPHLDVGFTAISASGESGAAAIDSDKKTVTLYMPETADLSKVSIVSYTINEGAEIVSPDLAQPLDLRNPVTVKMFLYYDYEWTITALQNIERYFVIDGQIGESVIDVPGRRIVVTVPESANLSALKVLKAKLGPEQITTVTPELEGATLDFSSPFDVRVAYHGVNEKWTIYVEQSAQSVSLTQVDGWTNVVWAYGAAQDGRKNGFQYRLAGDNNWIEVPSSWITHNGGSFSASIRHLKANTEYEVRAYSDEEFTAAQSVTTESVLTVPNLNFDDWYLDGKVWNPWAEGGEQCWDTGNKGATTLGDSNSVPTTETCDGKPGRAALLQTKFVGIAAVGKLAAGNLFTGRYVKTDGTNGILSFGRPFTGRPTRLRGFMKYTTSTIAYSNTDHAYLKGQPDTAVVYIALADWAQPYEIRTNPKNQQLFSPNLPGIIAYGEMKWGQNVDNFTEFDIPLKYNATNKVPTHILIVCTASKYGDFFTGGASSTLVVDNFALEWDYE